VLPAHNNECQQLNEPNQALLDKPSQTCYSLSPMLFISISQPITHKHSCYNNNFEIFAAAVIFTGWMLFLKPTVNQKPNRTAYHAEV